MDGDGVLLFIDDYHSLLFALYYYRFKDTRIEEMHWELREWEWECIQLWNHPYPNVRDRKCPGKYNYNHIFQFSMYFHHASALSVNGFNIPFFYFLLSINFKKTEKKKKGKKKKKMKRTHIFQKRKDIFKQQTADPWDKYKVHILHWKLFNK